MKPQRNSHDEAVSITTLVSRHRNPLARFCFEQAPNGRAELSFTGAAEEGQQFFVSTEKTCRDPPAAIDYARERSEEHTSELQSRLHLVCRLLLEKKKQQPSSTRTTVIYYHTSNHTHTYQSPR